MSKNGSLGLVVKIVLVLAVIAAGTWAVMTRIRNEATVVRVARGKAVDAVTGSVVVHADKDLFDLKSPLPGTVESCPGLGTAASFKAGEVLVKLDTRDARRVLDAKKREVENARQRVAVAFADNREWQAAKKKLDAAVVAENAAPAAEKARLHQETVQRQEE